MHAWPFAVVAAAVFTTAIAAEDPPSVQARPKAAISLTGRGGGTVTVIDRRAPNPGPQAVTPPPLNQTSPEAQERAAEAKAEAEADALQRQADLEAKRAAQEEAAKAEKEAPGEASSREKPLSKEEREKILREGGFAVIPGGEKDTPGAIFDPATRQMIKEEDAIKRQEERSKALAKP